MRKNYLIIIFLFLCFFNTFFVSGLSAVAHVPEKYTNVVAGERFYFEIEIKYPENPSRKDIILNYEILENGDIILQSKILKAIETQASFVDFLVIPDNAKLGNHILTVGISDYEGLDKEISVSFQVIRTPAQIKIYFFILLVAIILVGVLVIVNIVLGRAR